LLPSKKEVVWKILFFEEDIFTSINIY